MFKGLKEGVEKVKKRMSETNGNSNQLIEKLKKNSGAKMYSK